MPPAIPLATYRIQLTADFDFDAAAAIVPYLKALGISHLYASPFMKARAGSTHGYDIVDHTALNPQLGGEAAFERLTTALQQHDLGLILDFVPNHVGVHFDDNPWWLDVLEWGPASPHAAAFDIEWDILPHRTRGGVLLPIIGSSYGEALERGEIELRYDAAEARFSAWYHQHRLPIAPERYRDILRTVVKATNAEASPPGRAILDLVARYPGLKQPDRASAPAFRHSLQSIAGGAELIARGLDGYRAGDGRNAQTQALHLLLERQHYKLGHWRLAASEINYRRFFDVNTLAGLRVEDAATFAAIHRLVQRLVSEDKLHGLRLDHIDGLHDPAQYFVRLRRLLRAARGGAASPFYMVIEKILGEHETLPRFAGVHGTTGYEWLGVISRVLLDGDGLDALDEVWRQVSNVAPDFQPVLRAAKRRVLQTLLLSEFTVLARLLARIAGGHYSTRDFAANTLSQALELYVLHFPVYRTYLNAAGPTALDRALIAQTIERARAEWFGPDEGLFDFLRDVLTLDLIKRAHTTHSKRRVRRFALKLQQFTGPTMAKSLEDTAFYRYHRLLALNEVGGDPAAGELPIDAFHEMMCKRASDWPHGLTATATHDTKRGEDTRARLLALAELPGDWSAAVARWKLLNAPHLMIDNGLRAPSAPFEYMLYQTLLGAWPLQPEADFAERITAYALKAAREGKDQTSWLNPHAAYENGVRGFIERVLDPGSSGAFMAQMQTLAERVALLGALNSLAQLTLKALLAGVPDFYQGTEFWDLSLVDPDNRRPVDFATRVAALHELQQPDWAALAATWRDGRIKFAWTRELLRLRAAHPALFTEGSYQPLRVEGPLADRVIAFARRHDRDAVIVAIACKLAPLTDQGRRWPRGDDFAGAVLLDTFRVEDASDDGRLALADLFATMPVAVRRARYLGKLGPSRPRRTRN
jgi:(1->4)-alpha-D-glucan 1-alpha-D-glucosylmutase